MKELLMSILRSTPALTAGGSMFITANYVMYKDRSRYSKMAQTFSKGNILAPMAENHYEIEYLQRYSVERKLQRALQPTFTNEYYTVSGEVGSGKTRTIVEMVRSMMVESGGQGLGAPIYVLTTQGKNFADTLASAVNFNFDEHLSFKFFLDFIMRIHSFPERDDNHKLLRVLEAIEKSAFEYMQQHGRPVVIIIDGVNSLLRHMPHGLERLQQKAKLWADTNIAKVVFVFNDEKTESFLQEHRSNWSRAASQIYISDFSKDEVIRFLTSPKFLETGSTGKCMFTLEEALEIYEFVGGRVHHLVTFKRDREQGKTLEETAELLKLKECEKFIAVSKSSSLYKTMEMIKCSCHKGISLAKLTESTSDHHVEDLFKANIIKIERGDASLTGTVMVNFESKLTENVAKTLGKG